MPIDVNTLKRHMSDSPSDGQVHKNLMAILQQLQNTVDEQQDSMSRNLASSVVAEGEHIRAEAQARQATIDTRDVTRLLYKALQEAREEAGAAERKHFWQNIGIAFGASIIGGVVSWLLTSPTVGQALTHLLHP